MSRTVSFQPLLFGGDINVYSVARAFHEAYGVKSVAFGKFHTFPCAFSSIIDYRTCPDNEDPAVFLSQCREGGPGVLPQDRHRSWAAGTAMCSCAPT